MESVPTRTRILQAAMDLMAREGPDGFTAAALAREVGVSKATLFHHFDSLDEISLAALEEVFFEALDELGPASGRPDGSLHDFAERMHALVEDRAFLHAYFAFVIKGVFDDRFRERLVRGASDMHRKITETLAPSLAPGEDPRVTARIVEVMLDGMALHHLIMADHELLDRAWYRFTELLAAAQRQGGDPQ
jgi:AcrR family transcriptional regulator